MERKLLSLPSFFVLLLVAGIAFLTVPVVDVHATPPGAVTAQVIDPAGDADAPTSADDELTTAGMTDVVVLKIADTAVKLSSASGVTNAAGFGVEDLLVTVNHTVPDPDQSDPLEASKIRLTPIAAGATLPGGITGSLPGANQWFIVGVEVPENKRGTITVQVKAAHAELGSSFQEAGAGTDPYAGGSNAPTNGASNTIYYDTYNPVPTVTIHPLPANTALDAATPGATGLRTSAGREAFLVRFIIADADSTDDDPGFDGTPTFTSANIDIAGGSVEEMTLATAASADNTYWVHAYIQATSGASSVLIGVKAGAVTDKNGATNVATPITTSGTPPTLTDSNAKEVTVDTVHPVIAITTQSTPASPSAQSPLSSLAVTFTVQETIPPATSPTSVSKSDLADGDDGTLATAEVTVTGGALSNVTAQAATFNAVFKATITPSDTATEVVINVAANAVKDSSGNGNPAPAAVKVKTYRTADTGPAVTEHGTDTTDGFSVRLDMPANSFVVLARSGNVAHHGILSGVTVMDIKDDAWEDLSSFMGIGPGGAIDLIGPAPATSATSISEDLVISEIMWGSDAGLGTTLAATANSQWIELYNTKSTAISGTWELKFTKSGTGEGITNTRLYDKFTNFGLTQSNQFWAISDTDGGAYGQGGRTSSSGANIGTLRRLVSMERKIDFVKVKDANNDRTKQLEGVPAGDLAGSWQASKDPQGRYLTGRRLGTPGAEPFVTVGTTSISGSVVFNEIANRSNKKFDWIELYNPGSSDVKINGWVLSKVTAVNKDEELVKFESDENIVVPAKGFLLVVNEDPSETALAAGKNIDNPQSKANGLPTEFYINEKLDIPKEKFLLVLRTELKLNSHEKIVDIAGHLGALDLNHSAIATEVWPLRAWKRIKDDDLLENDSNTWRRDRGKNLHHGDAWKSDGGFTGLGIDRNPESDEGPTSGTPGFDNGAIKDKVKDLKASDPVVISEIMFGRGGTSNRPNPQWIELFNPSKTQAVKLLNWRLEIQNITIDPEENLNVDTNYTLILPDKLIQPNQTLLIVSASAREATRDRFPSDRIINVWSTRKLRETVEMTSARDAILSSVAFYMKLSDPDKTLVDHVGNIVRPRDTPRWDLPGGNLDEGGRASMIRREGTFGDGTEADAWISAATVESGEKVSINEIYYGDTTDLGTPGYRQGGAVPVQLSSFYSKRNDAGAVIITWSTESELDNAGFNILRSLSRAGEFTRINAQLIPGAGTTGEKNTYTWTDTSARPNVVYYYQIEDVSLDGEHRTLRTTRLRGYVGAAGKATTIWGELKSRD